MTCSKLDEIRKICIRFEDILRKLDLGTLTYYNDDFVKAMYWHRFKEFKL